MVGHIAVKPGFVRVSAKICEASKRHLILRKALRLLIGDHLQPVLNFAQKEIGPAQVRHSLARDPAFLAELIEHVERAAAPQARSLAAKDQLLGLDKKFDLRSE